MTYKDMAICTASIIHRAKNLARSCSLVQTLRDNDRDKTEEWEASINMMDYERRLLETAIRLLEYGMGCKREGI